MSKQGDVSPQLHKAVTDVDKFAWDNLNVYGNLIQSLRVCCSRSVSGYEHGSSFTSKSRLELEEKVVASLKELTGEFEGVYYPLEKVTDDHKLEGLRKLDLLPTPEMCVPGSHVDWPKGSGIFANKSHNLIIWVNVVEHLRAIAFRRDGDLCCAYKQVNAVLAKLSETLNFELESKSDHASESANQKSKLWVQVYACMQMMPRLPNFKEMCAKRGIELDELDVNENIYKLRSKFQTNLTEADHLNSIYGGFKDLFYLEFEMQKYNKDAPDGIMPVEPLMYLYQNLMKIDPDKKYTRKYLSEDIAKRFDGIRTKGGVMLAHILRSGCYYQSAFCPRTGEVECYSTFADYVNIVVNDYHELKDPDFKHPPCDFGDLDNLPFGKLDPSGKFVISTRIRVGRSVVGFQFSTFISKADRIRLESLISTELKSLSGDLTGTYYPLTNMTEEARKQLVEDHFLFKNDDPVLRDVGGYRDWPYGRGIFHNNDKTFLVWLNEEDHIRIISMQQGDDLAAVYKRLVKGIRAIESKMEFLHHDKYGYLNCCPSNMGTALRASVLLRIPKLSAQKSMLEEICAKYKLDARGLHGEQTESPDGIHDISNKRRLCVTEVDLVKEMADGVKQLIELEKSLS